jgi:hypothetical protein
MESDGIGAGFYHWLVIVNDIGEPAPTMSFGFFETAD